MNYEIMCIHFKETFTDKIQTILLTFLNIYYIIPYVLGNQVLYVCRYYIANLISSLWDTYFPKNLGSEINSDR